MLGDMVLVGDTIYAVSGSTLLIFTLDDPFVPVRAQTLELGGSLRSPCVTGDLFCVAVDDDGLRIYDISIRIAPVLLNTVPRLGTGVYEQITGVAVDGDLLAYAERDQPLRLMSIVDPLVPVEVGLITEAGLDDVALEGGQLALIGSSLRLYDITNPALPVETASETYHQSECNWSSVAYGRPVFHDGRVFAERKFICAWRDPYIYGDTVYPSYCLVCLSAEKRTFPEVVLDVKLLTGRGPRSPHVIADELLFADVPGYHEVYDLTGPEAVFSGYFPLLSSLNSLLDFGGHLYVGTDNGLVVTDMPGAYSEDYYLGEYGSNGGQTTLRWSTEHFDLEQAGLCRRLSVHCVQLGVLSCRHFLSCRGSRRDGCEFSAQRRDVSGRR